MVLADLGAKLGDALKRLHSAPTVDKDLIDSVLKDVSRALLMADVRALFVENMRKRVLKQVESEEERGSVNLRRTVHKAFVDELVTTLTSKKEAYKLRKGKSNVILFVGLQGAGKTTTCTKYANYYRKQGWKTALVCADTFRAGAFEQLKQNATKAKIPFYGNIGEMDPIEIATKGVDTFVKEKYELIIVDTSGRHSQESELFKEMKLLAKALKPDDICFVMDSHIGQACFSQASAFNEAVDVGCVIITKLDGHAQGGGAISAVAATDAPITFIGTGEHFHEFEPFNPKGFVSRLLGYGDIGGLMKTICDNVSVEHQEEMMKALTKGKVRYRDLYTQFQSVINIGSLSHLMSMVPGIKLDTITPEDERQMITRIKKCMYAIQSMTDKEADAVQPLNESRMKRIARGSGVEVTDLKMLIEQHKQLQNMVGSGAKSKMGAQKIMSKMAARFGRGGIDPRAMRQMGGMDFMRNMGDMPDMADLMKRLGGAGGGAGF